MDAHILLSLVGQKTETRFNCFLTENRKSTEIVGTPSTVCGLLPPLRRSPSLDEGGLGFRRSRPPALPSIAYRGFAVAPMTLRAPSRNLVYNPGCRVETLLVSKRGGYGVPRGARSLLPPLRRFPSLKEGGLGFCRSRPPALPSIAYWGFAVAPKPLRAPSRRVVVITSGTNGRAMRAPTGYGDAAVGCKCI